MGIGFASFFATWGGGLPPAPATGSIFRFRVASPLHLVASGEPSRRASLTAAVEIVKEHGWSRQNTLRRVWGAF
jgi:hypothetical protein